MKRIEEEHRRQILRYAAKAEGPFSLLQLAVRDVGHQLHAFRDLLPAGEWGSRVEPALRRLEEASARLCQAVKQLQAGPGPDGLRRAGPEEAS